MLFISKQKVVTIIQLCADQYSIEIDITNNSWCKCWLKIGESVTYLGAADLKYLKNHLLAGLDDSPKESSGHLHEYDVSWVLSLSEAHTVLYVAVDDQGKVLLLQDADAKEICMIKLSQDQYLQWLNQIQLI